MALSLEELRNVMMNSQLADEAKRIAEAMKAIHDCSKTVQSYFDSIFSCLNKIELLSKTTDDMRDLILPVKNLDGADITISIGKLLRSYLKFESRCAKCGNNSFTINSSHFCDNCGNKLIDEEGRLIIHSCKSEGA